LIDDSAMPIQLSSSLYREISSIINMSIELQQVKQVEAVLQNHRVWNKRKPIISNALKRHSYQRLQKLLLSLGRIDRSIKGMDNLNVIDELRTLLLNLAGKTQWAQ
jgi:DNA polymerase-3 subunit delta